MRRLGLLALLLAYLAANGVVFVLATAVPYAQLALYAGLESGGSARAYLDLGGPVPRLETPALVFICRDLAAKSLGHPGAEVGVALGEVQGGVGAKAANEPITDWATEALETLQACEKSLLSRGDSVDLALLALQHAHLWAATKDAHHKDSALKYISRSTAASPRRAQAAALNAKALGLLSP